MAVQNEEPETAVRLVRGTVEELPGSREAHALLTRLLRRASLLGVAAEASPLGRAG